MCVGAVTLALNDDALDHVGEEVRNVPPYRHHLRPGKCACASVYVGVAGGRGGAVAYGD